MEWGGLAADAGLCLVFGRVARRDWGQSAANWL